MHETYKRKLCGRKGSSAMSVSASVLLHSFSRTVKARNGWRNKPLGKNPVYRSKKIDYRVRKKKNIRIWKPKVRRLVIACLLFLRSPWLINLERDHLGSYLWIKFNQNQYWTSYYLLIMKPTMRLSLAPLNQGVSCCLIIFSQNLFYLLFCVSGHQTKILLCIFGIGYGLRVKMP